MNMAMNAAMGTVVKAPAAGRARHAVLAACVFLGACGVAPTGGPPQASFDFGPAPVAAPGCTLAVVWQRDCEDSFHANRHPARQRAR